MDVLPDDMIVEVFNHIESLYDIFRVSSSCTKALTLMSSTNNYKNTIYPKELLKSIIKTVTEYDSQKKNNEKKVFDLMKAIVTRMPNIMADDDIVGDNLNSYMATHEMRQETGFSYQQLRQMLVAFVEGQEMEEQLQPHAQQFYQDFKEYVVGNKRHYILDCYKSKQFGYDFTFNVDISDDDTNVYISKMIEDDEEQKVRELIRDMKDFSLDKEKNASYSYFNLKCPYSDENLAKLAFIANGLYNEPAFHKDDKTSIHIEGELWTYGGNNIWAEVLALDQMNSRDFAYFINTNFTLTVTI